MFKKLLMFFCFSFLLFGNLNYSKIKKYNIFFTKASQIYKVPKKVLMAIAFTENETLNPYIIRHNKNNTYDIGLMQINTLWVKELQYIGLSRKKLLDTENNIYVSSFILAKLIKRYGYSMETIAKYHSKNPMKQKAWIARFKRHLRNLRMLNL